MPCCRHTFHFHSPAGPQMTCSIASRPTLAGVSHHAAPARKPLSALPLQRTSKALEQSNSSWLTQMTHMVIRRGSTASLQHTAAAQQEEAAAASATVTVLVGTVTLLCACRTTVKQYERKSLLVPVRSKQYPVGACACTCACASACKPDYHHSMLAVCAPHAGCIHCCNVDVL